MVAVDWQGLNAEMNTAYRDLLGILLCHPSRSDYRERRAAARRRFDIALDAIKRYAEAD